VENELTAVPLHPELLNDYVVSNSYDEDDDEYISDYIDLILFAILTQIERQKIYLRHPTNALLEEILTHSTYISRAESSLNVHIVRIIHNFKASTQYDAWMSGTLIASQDHVPAHMETDAAPESKRIGIEIDDLTRSPIVIDDVPIALSMASAHLNEIDDIDIVKVNVPEDTYIANAHAIDDAKETESLNAKSNITTMQFNETDNAQKHTNDEKYTAKEQLHVIKSGTESTKNAITNEKFHDNKNTKESITKEIAKSNLKTSRMQKQARSKAISTMTSQ
jgi:hypothetical protein